MQVQVKILKNFEGCENGIDKKEYKKGDICNFEESFAEIIINKNYATTQLEKSKKAKKTTDKADESNETEETQEAKE